MAATVWRDNWSSGMGSIHDNNRELAVHKSGTAGRAFPRAPVSRKRSD